MLYLDELCAPCLRVGVLRNGKGMLLMLQGTTTHPYPLPFCSGKVPACPMPLAKGLARYGKPLRQSIIHLGRRGRRAKRWRLSLWPAMPSKAKAKQGNPTLPPTHALPAWPAMPTKAKARELLLPPAPHPRVSCPSPPTPPPQHTALEPWLGLSGQWLYSDIAWGPSGVPWRQ